LLLTHLKHIINNYVAVSLFKTEKSEKQDEKVESEKECEPTGVRGSIYKFKIPIIYRGYF
jgi:hypothetical protein